jgi:glycine cleavage system H protein
MSYPTNYKYTKEHEWVKIEGTAGIIGVTKYAIDQLGDVVYLDLPKIGSTYQAHDTFGTIESTKTVSDLFMPVAGKVTAINQNVVDAPEILTKDAFEAGWLIKVEITSLPNDLLSHTEYEKYIQSSH